MRLRRARGAAEDTPRSRGAAGDGEARGVTGRGARSPEGDSGTGLCPAGRACVGASRSLGDLNVRDRVVRRELGGGAHDCDRPVSTPPPRVMHGLLLPISPTLFLVGSERMHWKLESTRRLESKMNAI